MSREDTPATGGPAVPAMGKAEPRLLVHNQHRGRGA